MSSMLFNVHFFGIGDDIMQELLFDWVYLVDISRIDSAICNHRFRSDFLFYLRAKNTKSRLNHCLHKSFGTIEFKFNDGYFDGEKTLLVKSSLLMKNGLNCVELYQPVLY
jgi:hypothetical protein